MVTAGKLLQAKENAEVVGVQKRWESGTIEGLASRFDHSVPRSQHSPRGWDQLDWEDMGKERKFGWVSRRAGGRPTQRLPR